jgi:nitrogen fixation NifU-like protein
MMLELVIGRTTEEALTLKNTFMKMIKEKVSEEELEMLEEASSLQDISHMPARVKCAVLGWRTLEQILEKGEGEEVTTEQE